MRKIKRIFRWHAVVAVKGQVFFLRGRFKSIFYYRSSIIYNKYVVRHSLKFRTCETYSKSGQISPFEKFTNAFQIFAPLILWQSTDLGYFYLPPSKIRWTNLSEIKCQNQTVSLPARDFPWLLIYCAYSEIRDCAQTRLFTYPCRKSQAQRQ